MFEADLHEHQCNNSLPLCYKNHRAAFSRYAYYLGVHSLWMVNVSPKATIATFLLAGYSGAPAVGLTLSSLAAGAQTQVTLQLDNPTLNPLSYTPAFYGP